jgi:metallo-beta-lactamase family protein
MQISFHGGAGTVTGSRHLLEVGGSRVLVDAGLFQGLKELRLLNWRKPTFDPKQVDQLLLTHTHIDHAGYLPRLVKDGFNAPVHCTPATRELAKILLLDAAKIQEEDAAYANKKGFSKHERALPLYTSEDAEDALRLFRPVLGSAMVELEAGEDGGRPIRIVFSGDIGRYDMPLHPDPRPRPACDVLVVESTYGDRLHDTEPLADQIIRPFGETLARGGIVLIPSFAVGRAQQVTLILRELMESGKLPDVPIHIDSPMAVDATQVYNHYIDEHNLDACIAEDGRSRLFPRNVFFHRSVEESKRINSMNGPRLIISASGMMTSGRILHHLVHRMPDPKNLLCLVGYQAAGTRGRRMLEGARHIRIHGQDVPVRARFMTVHGLSGHADRNELLRWIGSAESSPSAVFVTHGEEEAAGALAGAVREATDARVFVPHLDSSYDLDAVLGGGGG